MEENPRKSCAAIDEYPDGACPSGRGSWNSGVGTGVARLHDARRTVRALLGRLLEEDAGSVAETTTMKAITLRAKIKRQRVGAGERANKVREEAVQLVIILNRLRALAGWCVLGQVRAGDCKPNQWTAAAVAVTCV